MYTVDYCRYKVCLCMRASAVEMFCLCIVSCKQVVWSGPDFCVQPIPVLWYKVSPQQKLGFSFIFPPQIWIPYGCLFSRVIYFRCFRGCIHDLRK